MTKGPDVKLCHAKAKTTGVQCTQPVVPGAEVCFYHGAGAKHVREAAQRRLLELAEPAIAALHRAMDDEDPKVRASAVTAAKDILDRAGLQATVKTENKTEISIDEQFQEVLGQHYEQYKRETQGEASG